ncbi:hypothetical protein N9483_03165 [Flavobacteriaceae bacterium]|nr:hypothetical protein [Flavobacteriaceae bacterium]
MIDFSACKLLDVGDYVASTVLLPRASLLGLRDNIKQVDVDKLYEMYQLISLVLQEEKINS